MQGPDSIEVELWLLDDDYLKFHNLTALFLHTDFIIL